MAILYFIDEVNKTVEVERENENEHAAVTRKLILIKAALAPPPRCSHLEYIHEVPVWNTFEMLYLALVVAVFQICAVTLAYYSEPVGSGASAALRENA